MDRAESLRIEVAYGERTRQRSIPVQVPLGAMAGAALAAALPRLRQEFPEADFASIGLAIWGETVTPETPLADGDRLELLRPLVADPKLARRRRVDATARRKPPGSVFRP